MNTDKSGGGSDNLPSSDCSPKDAIEAIVEKLPSFFRTGQFQSPEFVIQFRETLLRIMSSLPKDESRKALEIELAYIQHTISIEHGIYISHDTNNIIAQSIADFLRQEGVFEIYQNFSNGASQEQFIIDPDLFREYLDYLYHKTHSTPQDTARYLLTLKRLSQVDNAMDIVIEHIYDVTLGTSQDSVDGMVDQYGYLGGPMSSYDDGVLSRMEEYPKITRKNAMDMVDADIEESARIHIFLMEVFEEGVAPYWEIIDRASKVILMNLLNDLRDLLDPEQFIPIWFDNSDLGESLMRSKISIYGRVLH